MKGLKDILDTLVVNCGEEYHKLHNGTQEFELTNARINYYELIAIRHIHKLFVPDKKVEKEPKKEDKD